MSSTTKKAEVKTENTTDSVATESRQPKKVAYNELFWIFMIGNLFGVLLEGLWCLYAKGVWETHTVTIWGPFCLIYGVGFAGIYYAYKKLKGKNQLVKFFVIAVVADVVEYLCSCLLDYCLGMRAWDYSRSFMNLNGRITAGMTLVWGLGGLLFIRFIAPHYENLFKKTFKYEKAVCVVMSVFMAVNMFITSFCIVRWSERHFGFQPSTSIGRVIDKLYPDEKMQKIFVEWSFLS